MRLWHYKLIPYLPKSQLLAQWRELNSIFKKQDKHILINYIYEYPQEDLYKYSYIVLNELEKWFISVKSMSKFFDYFSDVFDVDWFKNPFLNHHNDRYLLQCFYNLQEKYDRGQKDFTEENYEKLEEFIKNETSNRDWS